MSTMTERNFLLRDTNFVKSLEKIGFALLIIGVVAGVASFLLMDADHEPLKRFFSSYLLAYTYFLGVAVTAMFFSALQYLVNAGWSALVRRIAEMFAPFIFVIILGFIPIVIDVFSTHQLFEWTHAGVMDPNAANFDPILKGKDWFLNPTFFVGRVVFYCLVWFLMYQTIIKNSLRQDEAGDDHTPTRRNKAIAAPMVILYALTISFAGIDLVMTLYPHWYSTMFGVQFFGGSFVATLSIIALFTVFLKEGGYLPQVTTEHYHDLGKMMFAFNVFWAYVSFSQFMLIWYGNLPEETVYFMDYRLVGGFEYFFYAIIVLHFALPFILLLPQANKRNPKILGGVAVLIILMHFIDLAWYVNPSLYHGHFTFGLQEISLFLFFAGMFVWMAASQFKSKKAVAVNDPFLEESVHLVS